MASAGLPLQRLRTFLGSLPPSARAMLAAEIERGSLGDASLAEILLEELRRDLRRTPNEEARLDHAARIAFAPLEPFLVDHAISVRPLGRIRRAALPPLWEWIGRDLMPEPTRVYSDQVTRAHLGNQPELAERLARMFGDRFIQEAQNLLAGGAGEGPGRRAAAQLRPPASFEDARELLAIFRGRDALNVLRSRLPAEIKVLADEHLDTVKVVLDAPVARHADVFPYALLLVAARLSQKWQLLRLATRAVESDLAVRVAESPYALAVTIVLDEAELMLASFRQALGRGDTAQAVATLKDIHDCARGLRTEMDLPADFPWSRRLAAIRVEVSDLISGEIGRVPARVRNLLRPAQGGRPDGTVGEDIPELEGAVDLVVACRNCASELAINEVTLRIHSDLKNVLEAGTGALLEGLRAAPAAERAARLPQAQIAVRLCTRVFGAAYGAQLGKVLAAATHGGLREAASA